MTELENIVNREMPVIHQITSDETWLEAERRGYCVRADDPMVRDHVCQVVLRIGAQLRASAQAALDA